MRGVSRHPVDFGALQKSHGDAGFAAIFDQALQAKIVALFRHANPFEGASAGLEGFGDGVDAVDYVHEVSVYRKVEERRFSAALGAGGSPGFSPCATSRKATTGAE